MTSLLKSARLRFLVVAVAVVSLTGCGEERADVTGAITYRGKPVVYGTVSVIGADQKTYYATINQDGTFTAPGVPVGPAKIGVYSPDPYYELPVSPDIKAQIEKSRQANGTALPPKPPKGKWVKLPPKYADPLSSGLTAEVGSQPTVVELSLN